MTRLIVSVCAAIAVATPSLHAQKARRTERIGTATITDWEGPSVKIGTSELHTVSARSSLKLDWVMVVDTSLSLVFDAPVGARGDYEKPWFHYTADLTMKAIAPVTAFEVRIITFDVWNRFTGTLAFSQLEDLKAGQTKTFSLGWGLLSESDVRDHFTSIAYVAYVKLQDGRVIAADPTPALKAAQAIQSNITLQDLNPRKEPGANPPDVRM